MVENPVNIFHIHHLTSSSLIIEKKVQFFLLFSSGGTVFHQIGQCKRGNVYRNGSPVGGLFFLQKYMPTWCGLNESQRDVGSGPFLFSSCHFASPICTSYWDNSIWKLSRTTIGVLLGPFNVKKKYKQQTKSFHILFPVKTKDLFIPHLLISTSFSCFL